MKNPIHYLLSHIEDFIGNENEALQESAKTFISQDNLEQVESLLTDPNDPQLPQAVMEKMSHYFTTGLLLQRGASEQWYVTDCFWRGHCFHLNVSDQISARGLVPEISPLQVQKADARKVFKALHVGFFLSTIDGQAYLVKPTPHVAFLLVSELAEAWSRPHVESAHKLINKSFSY